MWCCASRLRELLRRCHGQLKRRPVGACAFDCCGQNFWTFELVPGSFWGYPSANSPNYESQCWSKASSSSPLPVKMAGFSLWIWKSHRAQRLSQINGQTSFLDCQKKTPSDLFIPRCRPPPLYRSGLLQSRWQCDPCISDPDSLHFESFRDTYMILHVSYFFLQQLKAVTVIIRDLWLMIFFDRESAEAKMRRPAPDRPSRSTASLWLGQEFFGRGLAATQK